MEPALRPLRGRSATPTPDKTLESHVTCHAPETVLQVCGHCFAKWLDHFCVIRDARQGCRTAGDGFSASDVALSGSRQGVTPADPVTLAIVVCTLAGAPACAIYVPAQRAAGVDPREALRAE
jgi:hypothetical protein